LNVSVPVAIDLGTQIMNQHHREATEQIGKEIELEFDWAFTKEKSFLATGPLATVRTIQTLTNQLIRHFCQRGLVAVCTHPIGKQAIIDNVDKYLVRYSPTNEPASGDKLFASGKTLELHCNPNTLKQVIVSRYKERIELEYDVIVAIAKDNASGTFNNVREQIESIIGIPFPMTVILDNFTRTQVFLTKPAPVQSDIITYLYDKLPMKLLKDEKVGLCSFLAYPVAKDPFMSQVESFEIRVDPENQTNPEGVFSLNGKTLCLTFSLDNVISAASLNNWKERILDLLGLLLDVCNYETQAEFDSIQSKLNHSLRIKCPITIEWETLMQQPTYKELHPTDRSTIIRRVHTKFLTTVLLGDAGFTGPEGLCEFDATIEKLVQTFNKILVIIHSKGDLRVDNGTLVIEYSFKDVESKQYYGCHPGLEQLLNLRPIKQLSAIQRGEQTIKKDCATLLEQLPQVAIEVNWNDFVDQLGSSYVRTINEVAKIPLAIFMGSKRSFGNLGLLEMMQRDGTVRNVCSALKTLRVEVDQSNSTSKHYGKSYTLNPECFSIQHGSGALVIKTNLGSRTKLPGCGRVVQFVVNSGSALQEEERVIQEIINDMTRREQDDRARAIARAQDENESIDRQNKQDQEQYKRAMEDYNRKKNERCNYSQCNGGYLKCGVCQGRGHNTNNKITSTCSSCSGDGKRTCYHCNGTKMKYPNGPDMPSSPCPRSHVSIPTFGPIPNYRSQI